MMSAWAKLAIETKGPRGLNEAISGSGEAVRESADPRTQECGNEYWKGGHRAQLQNAKGSKAVAVSRGDCTGKRKEKAQERADKGERA